MARRALVREVRTPSGHSPRGTVFHCGSSMPEDDMNTRTLWSRRDFLQAGLAAVAAAGPLAASHAAERNMLYVACPGIRNYLQFGGAGLLVFDMDHGHRFLRRIDTPASRAARPENVKGICASARTGRLYFTTLTKLYCIDLCTDETLWFRAYEGGCDRLAIHPQGHRLYVPSLEKDHWHVVDASDGGVVRRVEFSEPKGAHNTICALDGTRVFLAGLRSRWLHVLDTSTNRLVGKVGPFTAPIRPFTVNAAATRCYCCVNALLGFEIGDLETGRFVARVEVKGFRAGPVKRHGCPSHGIGMTPDERELWVVDAHNQAVHVFAVDGDRVEQVTSITGLREQPGWVMFSLDGRYAYPSTGEVIDTATRRIVAALTDETGREVHSEKMVQVVFRGRRPLRCGDQFGIGRQR